jgi:hypothetical protein
MLQLKTLDLLPMTLDTYGLPEEEYLAVFEKKAEFACKALRIVGRVATDYNIKMEPKLFWDLYQEIGYATDDACRVKQKKEDPQALEERSYTSTTYPTTGAVFTEVQKLEKLMNTFIEQNKDGFLGEERESNFPNDQEFRVDSNGKILRKRKTPWYINSLALSEDDDEIKE